MDVDQEEKARALAGPGRDEASLGIAASQPEHDTGAQRWGASGGGGRCRHGGSATQVAETSLQGGQRRLTGWAGTKAAGARSANGRREKHIQVSQEQAPVLDHATQDVMRSMVKVVLRHEAEIQRLKTDVGYMVFIDTSGLGNTAPSSIHGRELVREVCPGHRQDAAEARSVPLHDGDPEDKGRGSHAARGPPCKGA